VANIRDVAQLAGVSLGTVSNAINRPELLASTTLQRIQKVIEELEFVPNASARNLRSRRNRVIGLVLPDVSNPFYTDLAKGVNDAAYASEYVVILCNTDGSAQKEVQYLDVLARQKC
jgi:LacI family transcriptional regulator